MNYLEICEKLKWNGVDTKEQDLVKAVLRHYMNYNRFYHRKIVKVYQTTNGNDIVAVRYNDTIWLFHIMDAPYKFMSFMLNGNNEVECAKTEFLLKNGVYYLPPSSLPYMFSEGSDFTAHKISNIEFTLALCLPVDSTKKLISNILADKYTEIHRSFNREDYYHNALWCYSKNTFVLTDGETGKPIVTFYKGIENYELLATVHFQDHDPENEHTDKDIGIRSNGIMEIESYTEHVVKIPIKLSVEYIDDRKLLFNGSYNIKVDDLYLTFTKQTYQK